MKGPSILPSGRLPSRMAAMICSSVQEPIPVSSSGVMFGVLMCIPGSSKKSGEPANSMPGTGPSGPRVVWQLPHAAMLCIR
jgi:hypothetical protein